VRFVYLDESGISTNEPITVVAGVIVDADKQWRDVAGYVATLIEEYVPKEHRFGFVFHAKELFHGSHIFDPKKYPPTRRREALKRLIEIPARFGLATVYGYSDKVHLKAFHQQHPGKHRQKFTVQVQALHHAMTYSYCAIAAERYMRDRARPEEIATLVAENNDVSNRTIKTLHHILRGWNLDSKEAQHFRDIGGEYLPLRKIVDFVHFAQKNEAFLLQLADACAFVYRCYLEGKSEASDLFDALSVNNQKNLNPHVNEDGTVSGYNILGYMLKQ
jgi:hypothetical protein